MLIRVSPKRLSLPFVPNHSEITLSAVKLIKKPSGMGIYLSYPNKGDTQRLWKGGKRRFGRNVQLIIIPLFSSRSGEVSRRTWSNRFASRQVSYTLNAYKEERLRHFVDSLCPIRHKNRNPDIKPTDVAWTKIVQTGRNRRTLVFYPTNTRTRSFPVNLLGYIRCGGLWFSL